LLELPQFFIEFRVWRRSRVSFSFGMTNIVVAALLGLPLMRDTPENRATADAAYRFDFAGVITFIRQIGKPTEGNCSPVVFMPMLFCMVCAMPDESRQTHRDTPYASLGSRTWGPRQTTNRS